jgi:hypothetical protein
VRILMRRTNATADCRATVQARPWAGVVALVVVMVPVGCRRDTPSAAAEPGDTPEAVWAERLNRAIECHDRGLVLQKVAGALASAQAARSEAVEAARMFRATCTLTTWVHADAGAAVEVLLPAYVSEGEALAAELTAAQTGALGAPVHLQQFGAMQVRLGEAIDTVADARDEAEIAAGAQHPDLRHASVVFQRDARMFVREVVRGRSEPGKADEQLARLEHSWGALAARAHTHPQEASRGLAYPVFAQRAGEFMLSARAVTTAAPSDVELDRLVESFNAMVEAHNVTRW